MKLRMMDGGEARGWGMRLCGALGMMVGAGRIWEQQQLGFPDGHRSELEQFLYLPHLFLATLLLVVGMMLLWRGRGFLALWSLLFVDWLAPWLLWPYFDHGQGG